MIFIFSICPFIFSNGQIVNKDSLMLLTLLKEYGYNNNLKEVLTIMLELTNTWIYESIKKRGSKNGDF